MTHTQQLLLIGCFCGLACAGAATDAWGEQKKPAELLETFEVTSQRNIATAYGILLAPLSGGAEGETPERMDASIRTAKVVSLGNDRWRFQIALHSDDYGAGNKLTVMATTDYGDPLPSEVRPLNGAVTAKFVSALCQEQKDAKDIGKLLALTEKDLDLLIKLRRDQHALREKELRKMLGGPALKKLKEFEEAQGLSYTVPLTADLPLTDLSFRIGALDALRAKTRK